MNDIKKRYENVRSELQEVINSLDSIDNGLDTNELALIRRRCERMLINAKIEVADLKDLHCGL